MKSESEVKKQLEDVYEHRFLLRIERKTKRCCRNCKNVKETIFDFGEFGKLPKLECIKNQKFSEHCDYNCKYTHDSIEKEMIDDISDPSICGAKEPKIAALLWVLHGGKQLEDKQHITDKQENKSFVQKVLGVFRSGK